MTTSDRSSTDELFRLLVASVRDYAIFVLDPRGHVATWNLGAQRIKGYTESEIVGSHFSRFYPTSDVEAGKCELELEVAARDGRFEDEGWRLRKDGTQFWANVVISAVRDHTGTLLGFSKVTRDLTERKRAEDDRAARLAAEQASRAKDEFLAMLGHELRNPLAPIVTALDLLKMRGEARITREHEIIERQVTHMVRLVDDLLDVSRITRGKVDLRIRAVDLRVIVAKAVETAQPLFEERRHHLDVKSPPAAVIVDGDELRLAQVITNLLTNAAKYSPIGSHVDVRIRHGGDTASVEVTDDGSGIHASLLPQVFDLFVQGAQGTERSAGGLGLGLTIVRSLVTMHGGTATARSEGPGKGSTFTVTLPTRAPNAAEAPETSGPLPAVAKLRILLVDDNEDARELLSDLLTNAGNEVALAGDGPEALTRVKTFAPHVAILDIGLPVMDGYELAVRLRETFPALYLIALSGYGQASDRARSKEAGFDHHLVKPVDLRKLFDLIASAPLAIG